MKMRENLFSHSAKGACLTYRKVRDAADDRYESVRVQCEDLWHDFAEHADVNFLKEFATNFHQRWFEMYLTVFLIRTGFEVKCPKPGPDVLVSVDERRIWVEAVCATQGQAGNPDSVPETKVGKTQKTPIPQYVTRIRSSLEEKAEKFRAYIEKETINRDDFTVIALNVSQISGLTAQHLDRCMLGSLYGVGDMVITFDRKSGRHISTDRENVQTISKTSGAQIGVQPFTDGSMENVSCALASCANAFTLPSTLGDDYVLYPNLSCSTRWTKNLLPVAEDWSFRETKEGWSRKKIDRV